MDLLMDVSVTKNRSRSVGGCNACTRNYHEHGCNDHWVWVIELRGVSVRVCEECRAELRKKLAEAR